MLRLPSNKPSDSRSVTIKMSIMGGLLAVLTYLAFFMPSARDTVDPNLVPDLPTPIVEVPQLDLDLLRTVDDQSRNGRLQVEREPLSHLLEKALDVGPTAARALGMPAQPVPMDTLRREKDRYRGAWLWYKGKLEEIAGPKQGHPVKGQDGKSRYGIYEATMTTEQGETVLFSFSLPPTVEIRIGGWVRTEGFFFKLRDTTFPHTVDQAPFLVGRELHRAYEDWAPVESIDPSVFAGMDDGHKEGEWYIPGRDSGRGVDEDQAIPLWHLASYARSQYPLLTKADWRNVPALNTSDQWDKIQYGELRRGTPMRLLGTFVRAISTEAKTNPLGLERWTEVWVQVRDLGGKLVPVWVPDRIDPMPPYAGLEIRAYYYKRYAYETVRGNEVITPLFVAAKIDRYSMETHPLVRDLGIGVLGGCILLIAGLWRLSRKERQRWRAHEDEIIARRRKRREQERTAAEASPAQ